MKKDFLTLLNNSQLLSLPPKGGQPPKGGLPDTSMKSLSIGKIGTGGRNNQGRITVRRRGGGHKRRIYTIDFSGSIGTHSSWTIKDIIYNPNTSSQFSFLCSSSSGRLKLLPYIKDYKINMLAPNYEEIGNIRVGTNVCNLEITPGSGSQYLRAAGVKGSLIKKDKDFSYIKLPSNKIIKVRKECKVIKGIVGNEEHRNRIIGKAGRNRWLGIRPKVRGEAMNPVDHPHGGKTSRSGTKGKPFKNIWGKLAKWS